MLWHKAQGAGGVGGLVFAQEDSYTQAGSYSGATWSFSPTLATPSSGREVYVVIPNITRDNVPIQGVTFDGTSMTEVYQVTNGNRANVGFWKISDSTATSPTIVVDIDDTRTILGRSANVFSVYGAGTVTETASDSTATGLSSNFSISASEGDALLWGYCARNGGNVTVTSSPSLTVTEDYDLDLATSDYHAGGYISPDNMTSAITSLTQTPTASADDLLFAAIVLSPA